MVFDVESIGLHGEGFAVGWVVVDREGTRISQGKLACHPDQAEGDQKDRDWVRDVIPPISVTHRTPKAVRDAFWEAWSFWKENDAVLVADCCWPVEARFLAACVDDDKASRTWDGPYPLHELASILLSLGEDPLKTTLRHDDELPLHDPLSDARQSARQLVDALKKLKQTK